MNALLTQQQGYNQDYLLTEPLEILDEVHPTFQVLAVHDDALWPIIPRGSVIVYEPGKFCPVDGALVIIGGKSHRHGPNALPRVDLYAVQQFQVDGDPDHWWTGFVHRPRSSGEIEDMIHGRRRFVASDGPWPFDAMIERTYGRVIGLYQPRGPRSAEAHARRLN